MEGVILVFGDSIAYGKYDLEKQGWANRLREYIDKINFKLEDFYFLVYNLGISGETTGKLLKRLKAEIENRKKNYTIIIFQIGVNDTQWLINEKRIRTNKEEFERNIREIIKITKEYAKEIIFISLLPVDERKVNPVPWNPSKAYKNEIIKEYNEILKRICKSENVSFVDIFDEWIKDYRIFLEDGIHPNSLGHEHIFKKVKEVLETCVNIEYK